MTAKCRGPGRIGCYGIYINELLIFIKQSLYRLDRITTGLTYPMEALRAGRVAFRISPRPEKRWKIPQAEHSPGSDGRHHVRMWVGKHLGSLHTGMVSFSWRGSIV